MSCCRPWSNWRSFVCIAETFAVLNDKAVLYVEGRQILSQTRRLRLTTGSPTEDAEGAGVAGAGAGADGAVEPEYLDAPVQGSPPDCAGAGAGALGAARYLDAPERRDEHSGVATKSEGHKRTGEWIHVVLSSLLCATLRLVS